MAGAAPVDSVAEQFAGLAVNRTQVEIEARKEEDTVGEEEDAAYPHIFVVGDAADAFGALKAGHTAYWQVSVLFFLFSCGWSLTFLAFSGGYGLQEHHQTHQGWRAR